MIVDNNSVNSVVQTVYGSAVRISSKLILLSMALLVLGFASSCSNTPSDTTNSGPSPREQVKEMKRQAMEELSIKKQVKATPPADTSHTIKYSRKTNGYNYKCPEFSQMVLDNIRTNTEMSSNQVQFLGTYASLWNDLFDIKYCPLQVATKLDEYCPDIAGNLARSLEYDFAALSNLMLRSYSDTVITVLKLKTE